MHLWQRVFVTADFVNVRMVTILVDGRFKILSIDFD